MHKRYCQSELPDFRKVERIEYWSEKQIVIRERHFGHHSKRCAFLPCPVKMGVPRITLKSRITGHAAQSQHIQPAALLSTKKEKGVIQTRLCLLGCSSEVCSGTMPQETGAIGGRGWLMFSLGFYRQKNHR